MIEVLVAVLLFAIGILGIVGLQASMVQAQTDSKVRAEAANLVDEVATLMWSDVNKGKPAPATLANIAAVQGRRLRGQPHLQRLADQGASHAAGGTLDQLSFDETIGRFVGREFGSVTVQLSWSLPNGAAHEYVSTFNVAPSTI